MAAPPPVDPVAFARRLVDIDSTSGSEAAVGGVLVEELLARGYHVEQQPVSADRFNVFAWTHEPPVVVFSTHIDCVPPFFPSREADGRLYGRGACDAKGIVAAQIAAADALRAQGEHRIGLLYVVGEERGSDGAREANRHAPPGVRYLIDGEPTDSRLGLGTRGVLRMRLSAPGVAAHSAYPELGDSAINKLLDALAAIRGLEFPVNELFGTTHFSIGLIQGGVASNVIAPHATAELVFRTVSDGYPEIDAVTRVAGGVAVETLLNIPAVRLLTLDGFDTATFSFGTDIPLLTNWGTPLLFGPGSIHRAHTSEEFVDIAELRAAVGHYVALAGRLLVR